jgi:hypothetical protein
MHDPQQLLFFNLEYKKKYLKFFMKIFSVLFGSGSATLPLPYEQEWNEDNRETDKAETFADDTTGLSLFERNKKIQEWKEQNRSKE